jgi:hypothetical protein
MSLSITKSFVILHGIMFLAAILDGQESEDIYVEYRV